MSSPLQFYNHFSLLLKQAKIRYALTSGMACVAYGIQQTTKDTDWIVDPNSLSTLVETLAEQEKTEVGWNVNYRSLFGAPLSAKYLSNGWTSHLAIFDSPGSMEHHLDFFGKPPRLSVEAALAGETNGVATRSVVAQMKKTDRPKDWPFVNGLALQLLEAGDHQGLLHLRTPELLKKCCTDFSSDVVQQLGQVRPVLLHAAKAELLDLERLLHIEELVWHSVNKERYREFQSAWKEFYRRWQAAESGSWPSQAPFLEQHERLLLAAAKYELTEAPLGSSAALSALYDRGVSRATALARAGADELHQCLPPVETMLT